MNNLIGQLKGPKYDERLLFKNVRGLNLSFVSQTWKLTDSSDNNTDVTQVSTPISTSIPITNRLLITINSSLVTSKSKAPEVVVDTSGKTTSLDQPANEMEGMSDTRVSLSYVAPNDKLWINGGINLPTGIKKLSTDQFKVSKMISQAGLGFRVPSTGQGVNTNLGLTYAYSYSRRIVLGFGASGTFKSTFEPVQIDILDTSAAKPKVDYNPGEEFSFNSGVNYISVNKDQRFSSDVTFSYYLPDQINEKNTFQTGARINGLFLFSQKFGPTNNLALLKARFRLKNKIFSSDSLNTPTEYPSATQLEFQYNISWSPAQIFTINGSLEYKFHTEDQFPLGDKIMKTGNVNMLNYGVDITYPVTDWIVIMLATKLGNGKLVVEGTEYNASGVDFGFGLKVSL
ncbi:MAG: hypothetical protein O3A55_03500 [Bacteroidetes bacterium]|nr:hypothetical protein [Bacteroidota bacterium]